GQFRPAHCKKGMKIEIATIATTGTTIANTGIITPGMIASNVHTGTGWKNDAKNIANLRKRISNSKRNTGDAATHIPATHGNAVRANLWIAAVPCSLAKPRTLLCCALPASVCRVSRYHRIVTPLGDLL